MGRYLVGRVNGEPQWAPGEPKRCWVYGPALYGWPLALGCGTDEFCNPTVYLATWLGWVVVAVPRRLRRESCGVCRACQACQG